MWYNHRSIFSHYCNIQQGSLVPRPRLEHALVVHDIAYYIAEFSARRYARGYVARGRGRGRAQPQIFNIYGTTVFDDCAVISNRAMNCQKGFLYILCAAVMSSLFLLGVIVDKGGVIHPLVPQLNRDSKF